MVGKELFQTYFAQMNLFISTNMWRLPNIFLFLWIFVKLLIPDQEPLPASLLFMQIEYSGWRNIEARALLLWAKDSYIENITVCITGQPKQAPPPPQYKIIAEKVKFVTKYKLQLMLLRSLVI